MYNIFTEILKHVHESLDKRNNDEYAFDTVCSDDGKGNVIIPLTKYRELLNLAAKHSLQKSADYEKLARYLIMWLSDCVYSCGILIRGITVLLTILVFITWTFNVDVPVMLIVIYIIFTIISIVYPPKVLIDHMIHILMEYGGNKGENKDGFDGIKS